MEENDIAKMYRLGKKDKDEKPRLLLIGMKSAPKEEELMQSLSRLTGAEPRFQNVSVANKLPSKQRQQIKKLLVEAKGSVTGSAISGSAAENKTFRVVDHGLKL